MHEQPTVRGEPVHNLRAVNQHSSLVVTFLIDLTCYDIAIA